MARLKPAQCDFGHGLWRNNRLFRQPERAFRAFAFAPEHHPTRAVTLTALEPQTNGSSSKTLNSNSICQDLGSSARLTGRVTANYETHAAEPFHRARTRRSSRRARTQERCIERLPRRRGTGPLSEQRFNRAAPTGFASIRVHDLKHTFGRRLRAAGVTEEDRKVLLGHKNGSITSHYSAAELGKLIDEANKISATDSRGPALTILRRKAG